MNISKHPYEPYVPKWATKLIIGTIPPYRFCVNSQKIEKDDVLFYYGSRDNYLWDIFAELSNHKLDKANTDVAIKQRKELLDKFRIGITDIIATCIHKDGKSDDASLQNIKFKDIEKLLADNPKIDTLLYTSDFVKRLMNEKFETYHNIVDKNAREYSININNKKYRVIILYSPSPTALRGLGKGGEEKRKEQYSKYILSGK